VFSMLNFEECSFRLFESVPKSLCRSSRTFPEAEGTTMSALVRPQRTPSGYQDEAPDSCFPRFLPTPAGRRRSPLRSLERRNTACRLCTATTGTTLSRASELHGTLSRMVRPRFARAAAFSTTGFSANCWDSRAGTRASSKSSSSRSLVCRLALHRKFKLRWGCASGHLFPLCLCRRRQSWMSDIFAAYWITV